MCSSSLGPRAAPARLFKGGHVGFSGPAGTGLRTVPPRTPPQVVLTLTWETPQVSSLRRTRGPRRLAGGTHVPSANPAGGSEAPNGCWETGTCLRHTVTVKRTPTELLAGPIVRGFSRIWPPCAGTLSALGRATRCLMAVLEAGCSRGPLPVCDPGPPGEVRKQWCVVWWLLREVDQKAARWCFT